MSDTAPPAVSVIVPVYDEVDNVGPLHAAIAKALAHHDHEVVYVNDGSQDGTFEARPGIRRNHAAPSTRQYLDI